MTLETYKVHREEMAFSPCVTPTTNIRLARHPGLDGPTVLVRVQRAGPSVIKPFYFVAGAIVVMFSSLIFQIQILPERSSFRVVTTLCV
jgi:hypothetical protein